MAFFSILAAVVLEHVRPQKRPLPHYQAYASFTHWLESKFNAGEFNHGVIAWTAAVVPLLFGVWLIGFMLGSSSSVLAWGWNVAVLYFTLGFKYFSDDAETIARLLRAGEIEQARSHLASWRGSDSDSAGFTQDEISRVTIEQVIAASQRQMFGVLLWFVLLSPLGPVGAVLYRAASILARRWAQTAGAFGDFARQAFHVINWLPARLTALTYAIAGDFEDAMYCWRTQAPSWPEQEEGVVLAAGAGAMGVRIGLPLTAAGELGYRPELGLNQAAEPDHIDSAVSMVWRGLTIWLIVGLLLLVAGWAA